MDSKVNQAIQKLLNSQAQKNLIAVDQQVKSGTYQGSDVINYPDGSRIYIDLETGNCVASCP